MPRNKLLNDLTAAADLIVTEEVSGRWDWWISYLLEAIESKVSPEAFTGFLENVQEAVQDRLWQGVW